jgi:CheY-like chemotaxis protein
LDPRLSEFLGRQIADGKAAPARRNALPKDGGICAMMRVLVIDDDANVAAAIRAILSRHDYETIVTARSHAGIHALGESKFDIAIVDIFLPGMNGLDAIRLIRQKAPDVAIVAMTGFRLRPAKDPDADFLTLALQRGATACLRKPFAPQQLMDAINSSLTKVQILNGLSQ